MKRAALILIGALILSVAVFPLSALADIPLLQYGPLSVTTTTNLPSLNLSGQSSCSMTLSGSGAATLTPQGSSDNGATWATVSTIGAQTSNGTYGNGVSPYLTNFRVAVSGVTGTVSVSEACSSSVTPASNAHGQSQCALSGSVTTCSATAVVPAGTICTASYDDSTTVTMADIVPLRLSVSGTTLTLKGESSAALSTGTFVFDWLCF